MIDFSKELDKVGSVGVPLYRQSLEKWDRVATGKTRKSIRFESKPNKLTFYALDHIRDLENGKTAQQVQQDANNPSFFDQINKWVQARCIRANTANIARSLMANGWNTTRPNRTGQNGGTKGIITDIDKQVIELATTAITKGSKKQILETLKVSK